MPSIKKTKSGKYHTLLFLGYDENGKRKYKSITADTQKEVRQLMAKAMMETPQSYADMTLEEAYKRYIDSKCNVISPSTLKEYRKAMHRDFPLLLPMKLSRLSNEIIQTAINEIAAINSPKTVRNKYYLLESVLKAYRPDLKLNIRMPQKKEPDLYLPSYKLLAHPLLAEAFLPYPLYITFYCLLTNLYFE